MKSCRKSERPRRQSTTAIRNKPFDAVQMMYSIRNNLGKQVRDMTFEQERGRANLHSQAPL